MSQNSVNTDMPIQVAKGGTGAASHTAYSVLCGGTTSTSDIQPIAGVGSAGQALTSNGAGVLPTFQNQSGGGGADLTVDYNNDYLQSSHYHCVFVNLNDTTAISDLGGVADAFYAHPVIIRADVTAATTALYLGDPGSDQEFRFAIFTDDAGDFGTRLFESGEIDATFSGAKIYSSSVSYSAGPAWLVIAVKNANDFGLRECDQTVNAGWIANPISADNVGFLHWTGTYGEIASDLTFSGKSLTASLEDPAFLYITIS